MSQSLDTVVLVHGLWVHGAVMVLMKRRIARAGYRVLAYSYPTLRLSLTENAHRLARYCRDIAAPRLHFVGHSLGGLIVLRMLKLESGLPPGRVVLAGMPFTGSYAARRFLRLPGAGTAVGRSVSEWLAAGWREVGNGREIGVVAGSLPLGLGSIVAPDLPRPSDGLVSVAETAVPGMRDRIVLRVSHSGMLVSGAVARQVCAFLREGAFVHQSVTGDK